eukprot:7388072-Prymnesium_polylepis.1
MAGGGGLTLVWLVGGPHPHLAGGGASPSNGWWGPAPKCGRWGLRCTPHMAVGPSPAAPLIWQVGPHPLHRPNKAGGALTRCTALIWRRYIVDVLWDHSGLEDGMERLRAAVDAAQARPP